MNSAAHSFNVAVFFAVLFLIVSHPLTYKLVHRLFKPLFSVADKSGCATMHGLLLHTLVFGVVVFLISHFFGSSNLEMMTNGPAPADDSHVTHDAMGSPTTTTTTSTPKDESDESDESNMMNVLTDVHQESGSDAQGVMADSPDNAATLSDSAPTDGVQLSMEDTTDGVAAAEPFTGYAPVF